MCLPVSGVFGLAAITGVTDWGPDVSAVMRQALRLSCPVVVDRHVLSYCTRPRTVEGHGGSSSPRVIPLIFSDGRESARRLATDPAWREGRLLRLQSSFVTRHHFEGRFREPRNHFALVNGLRLPC